MTGILGTQFGDAVAEKQNPLYDVKAQERAEDETLKQRRDQIERSMAVSRRALALRSAPGYEDFVKEVENCHRAVARDLLVAKIDNNDLRETRGRARGLQDILTLLTKADLSMTALEQQLKDLQDEEQAMMRRRPKARPEQEPTGA